MLLSHFKEIGIRLLYVFATSGLVFCISYYYRLSFIYLLLLPYNKTLGSNRYLVTQIETILFTQLYLSFLLFFVFVCFFSVVTIVTFLLPGVYRNEVQEMCIFLKLYITCLLTSVVIVGYFFQAIINSILFGHYNNYLNSYSFRIEVTLINCIDCSIFVVFFLLFSSLFVALGLFIIQFFDKEGKFLYVRRIVCYVSLLVAIIVAIPPEPILHVAIMVLAVTSFEFYLLCVSVHKSYKLKCSFP